MTAVSAKQRCALAQTQEAIVRSVMQGRALAEPGLVMTEAEAGVYRRNIEIMARNALAVSFPTVHQLLGPTRFNRLASKVLERYPPDTGDWGAWGRAVPGALIKEGFAADFPFLVPVARLDWRVHQSSRATDNRLHEASLQLLRTEKLERLTIELAEHCSLLSSRYPLIEIRDWQGGEPQSLVLGEMPLRTLVFRPRHKVELRVVDEEVYQFMLGLKRAYPIAYLLEELIPRGFEFPRWVEFAIQHNLIHQFRTL